MFFQVNHLGFFRTDIQAEPVFQPILGGVEQFFRVLVVAGEDFEIIRIPYTGYFFEITAVAKRLKLYAPAFTTVIF